MKQASLHISKIATLINGNACSNFKLGEIANKVQGFNSLKVTMTATPAKANRYKSAILAAGFVLNNEVCTNAGWDNELADVCHYEIYFTNN